MAKRNNGSRTNQTEATQGVESSNSASAAMSTRRMGASRGGGNTRNGRRAQQRRARREQQRESGMEERSQTRLVRAANSTSTALRDAGSRVVEAVTENPVPAILIGAGLAWLLLDTRVAHRAERKLLNQARSAVNKLGETITELAGSGRESYSRANRRTQNLLSDAAESIKQSASALAHQAQHGAEVVGESAQAGYERSREAIAGAWEKHPLAVGASILAAGVATGMMLPATVREGTMFGDAASNVAEKIRSTGSDLLERGKDLATSSAQMATRVIKRQGSSRRQSKR